MIVYIADWVENEVDENLAESGDRKHEIECVCLLQTCHTRKEMAILFP